jgi:type II secretory pathway pseudopilin PulG
MSEELILAIVLLAMLASLAVPVVLEWRRKANKFDELTRNWRGIYNETVH